MSRKKSKSSIPSRIENRIQRAPADKVFCVADFLDLGTRTSVDAALSWMAGRGSLRRLGRGLYCRPRHHPLLGELTPSKDAIVAALARRDHIRIRPIDALAANVLGLSEQVPAKVDYLTDGRARILKIGKQVITLRHVSPKNMAAGNSTLGFVIAGLRNLGKKHIAPEQLQRLRNLIPETERKKLLAAPGLAPAWMLPHLKVIAGEQDK